MPNSICFSADEIKLGALGIKMKPLAVQLAVVILATLIGCADTEKTRLEAEKASAVAAKAKAKLELERLRAETAKEKENVAAMLARQQQTSPPVSAGIANPEKKEYDKKPTEQEIVNALKQRLARFEQLVQQSDLIIASLKYDVTKSNSLVAPYEAIVRYESCASKSLQDNRHAWKEHQDKFGWRDGQWITTQRMMRSVAYNEPLKDARSSEFLRVDANGNVTNSYVMDDLYEFQDEAFSAK